MRPWRWVTWFCGCFVLFVLLLTLYDVLVECFPLRALSGPADIHTKIVVDGVKKVAMEERSWGLVTELLKTHEEITTQQIGKIPFSADEPSTDSWGTPLLIRVVGFNSESAHTLKQQSRRLADLYRYLALEMSQAKKIEGMIRAAGSGDLSVVRMALDSGVDADSEDRHGNRAINQAAKAGSIEIVKLLIQRGANVNQADRVGRTPLIACAESDNVEMANLLLTAGADVNGTGDGGRTASMECANSSAFTVANRLLELGANVNMIRDDGCTGLHEAVFSACVDFQPPSENRIIPLLIESGADPGRPDHAGLTPLDLAAQYANEINYVQALNQTKKAK